MRCLLYILLFVVLGLLGLSQVEDVAVIRNLKLEVIATFSRHWTAKKIQISPMPASHQDNSTNSTKACVTLLRDSRWRTLSQQVWDRANRTHEEYPLSRVDPIIMIRDKAGSVFAKPFAMCTIAKNGCSRWRRLLRRMVGYKDYMIPPHDPKSNGLTYPPDVRHEEIDRIFRWGIVRDPHERLVSAWSEKCNTSTESVDYNCGDWIECEHKHDFREFVMCLWQKYQKVSDQGRYRKELCAFNEHFRPQMCDCNLEKMRYNVLLPVEYIDAWYPELVQCLQLEAYTHDFWGRKRPFYSKSVVSIGSHSTHAAAKMKKLYTKELYDFVSEIYRDDLVFSQHMVSFD